MDDEKPNRDQLEPKSALEAIQIEKSESFPQMALGGQSSPDVTAAAITNPKEPMSATLQTTKHIEVKKLGDENDEGET